MIEGLTGNIHKFQNTGWTLEASSRWQSNVLCWCWHEPEILLIRDEGLICSMNGKPGNAIAVISWAWASEEDSEYPESWSGNGMELEVIPHPKPPKTNGSLKCLTCIKLNLCSSPKVYSTSNSTHNTNLLSSTILFVREGFPEKYNQCPEDSKACSTIHTTTIHDFDQLQAWSRLIQLSRRKSWTFKTITQHNQFTAWTDTTTMPPKRLAGLKQSISGLNRHSNDTT